MHQGYLSVISELKLTSSQVNADASDENPNNGKAAKNTITFFISYSPLEFFLTFLGSVISLNRTNYESFRRVANEIKWVTGN